MPHEHQLDAREIDEPFDDIMAALSELDEGDTLTLVNSFEPEPLYNVLENRGFTYEAEEDNGVWYVDIEHI
ncbi:MAG: DUF2249 domain-containing protein [Halobacteria archaeon]|nr:DUF2249 domain-containing protein [Halobacteria archaeon]